MAQHVPKVLAGLSLVTSVSANRFRWHGIEKGFYLPKHQLIKLEVKKLLLSVCAKEVIPVYKYNLRTSHA
jgi:hypothetical protein